jgi:hypothetical protein
VNKYTFWTKAFGIVLSYRNMGFKNQKRAREVEQEVEEEVEPTRGSEEEPAPKKAKWTNKTRVLVISARGIGFRY